MKYAVYTHLATNFDVHKPSIPSQNKLFDNSMNSGLFAWLLEMMAFLQKPHIKTPLFKEIVLNASKHLNKRGGFL